MDMPAKKQPARDGEQTVIKLERNSSRHDEAINNLESIPEQYRLASQKGGECELTKAQQQSLAILASSTSKTNEVLFLHTREANKQTVASQVQLLRMNSYNVTPRLCTKVVLDKLYDKSSVEEEYRHNKSELQRDFHSLILEALSMNASDIHIENQSEATIVRFRLNGLLVDRHRWDTQFGREMSSVIYNVISEEQDTQYNAKIPQSAIIDYSVEQKKLRLRLQTLNRFPEPCNDVILRLLPMGVKAQAVPLQKLGYHPAQVHMMNEAVLRPVGAMIICGTTGSGKSTSLQSILIDQINKHHGTLKVITVEDPVEYEIPGATQNSVVRSRDANKDEDNDQYADFIRTALRSDPDTIMVGEVRDRRAADAFKHVVLTGHKAFSTVHAGTAFGIVTRFSELQISDNILSDPEFFTALVYQTLLQTLCVSCAIPFVELMKKNKNNKRYFPIIKRVSDVAKDSIDKVYIRNPAGCKHCNEVGISGRTVAAEIVLPDSTLYGLLTKETLSEAKKYWLTQRKGITVLQHAISKMLKGQVDPFHIEKQIAKLDSEDLHSINLNMSS